MFWRNFNYARNRKPNPVFRLAEWSSKFGWKAPVAMIPLIFVGTTAWFFYRTQQKPGYMRREELGTQFRRESSNYVNFHHLRLWD